MPGPRHTPAQQKGQLAEQIFGAFVIQHGDLWHPTSLGNDIGIDGRVEVLEAGEPTGVEFGVQVKGSDRLAISRRGNVSAGRAKSSTVRYWLTRLSPTLVAAYDQHQERLYAEWAHRLPGLVDMTRRASPPQRVTLKLPAEQLTSLRWTELRSEAAAMHGLVTTALEDQALREMMGLLHVQLSSIQDVLVEWVYTLAYPGGPTLNHNGETVHLPPLGPSRLVAKGGQMFPMWLAEGAKTLTASFSRSLESRLAPEHPLRRLVADLAESLAYELDLIIKEKQPPRSAKRPAAVVATADFATLVVRLGVVGLRIATSIARFDHFFSHGNRPPPFAVSRSSRPRRTRS